MRKEKGEDPRNPMEFFSTFLMTKKGNEKDALFTRDNNESCTKRTGSRAVVENREREYSRLKYTHECT
jgi:hypothetical protein